MMPAPKCWVDSAPQATPNRRQSTGGASGISCRDVAGQERIAGADARARLLLLDPDAVQRRDPVLDHLRITPVRNGHDRFGRAEAGDLGDRARAVVDVVELVPDELLGLELVRRDDVRLGAHRQPQRLAFGVEHRRDAKLSHVSQQARVHVRIDARGAGFRRTRRCWRPWPGTAASRGTARARARRPRGRAR